MSEDKVRSAGVRKTDRLVAGQDTAGIVQSVKEAQEIASTHRVYVKTWLLEARHATAEDATSDYETRFLGRLQDGDFRIDKDPINKRDWLLWTNRWTVMGEWKTAALAEEHAEKVRERFKDVTVVPRNSRREHVLTQYGIVKIVAPKS